LQIRALLMRTGPEYAPESALPLMGQTGLLGATNNSGTKHKDTDNLHQW
jgi:hypothetical protein